MTMPLIIVSQDISLRQSHIEKIVGEKANSYEILKTAENGINDVRQWIKWLNIGAQNGITKVLIISAADKLSTEAQNALLKTLEEPPDNSKIIMEASDSGLLLPTVLSRCEQINLKEGNHNLDSTVQQQIDQLNSQISFSLDLAGKIADREKAIEWLDKAMVICRQDLFTDSSTRLRIEKIIKSKQLLKSNTNVRLTLENLFLNW